MKKDILNLGCGPQKMADAVNVDIAGATAPDVCHDLNARPWPFENGQFREVHAYDVLEHLKDVLGTLEEIHRICKPGASLKLTVPHFSNANAFSDPTHRHFFGLKTFRCATEGNELSFYTRVHFRERACRLIFEPSLWNKLVWRLANRFPERYEQRWAWMFPAWFVYAELEVVKSG
jgi:SAM-dependent methyltransferase